MDKQKRCIRYFGPFLGAQERWLNRMAEKGYRLTGTGVLGYAFVPCRPGQVRYCVEWVGEKSPESAGDYRAFLEGLGYRVLEKNVNCNLSLWKLRWRPWAERGGRMAAGGRTFGREIFLVEKDNDGRDFVLHTALADRRQYLRRVQAPWLWLALFLAVLGIGYGPPLWLLSALLPLAPALALQAQIGRLRRRERTEE